MLYSVHTNLSMALSCAHQFLIKFTSHLFWLRF